MRIGSKLAVSMGEGCLEAKGHCSIAALFQLATSKGSWIDCYIPQGPPSVQPKGRSPYRNKKGNKGGVVGLGSVGN